MHTRISKTDDIEKISHILALSWKTAYRGIVNDDYLDTLKDNHWVEFLTVGLKNGNVFSMVLENNQEIIGAAILSDTESEQKANLISLYLLPDKIGQGFGHTFYSAIETELRERGFRNCTVDVLENGAFYAPDSPASEGFETVEILAGDIGVCWLYGIAKRLSQNVERPLSKPQSMLQFKNEHKRRWQNT